MKKKNLRLRKPHAIKNKSEYQWLSYEITDEPIIYASYRKLPQTVKEELTEIQAQLNFSGMYKKGLIIIPRLEELVAQYPEVELIANYLAKAYSFTRDAKLANLICENYRKYPDYLFARIQYATYCLDRHDIETMQEIFKEGFDLKALYPHRHRFHVSEFVGFGTLMCRYYRLIGDSKLAVLQLEALEKVNPQHPAVIQMGKFIRGTWLTRLLEKLGLLTDAPTTFIQKTTDFKA